MENVRKVRKFRRRFKRSRVKSKAGQGVQTIGFHDEQRTLYRQLKEECESFCSLTQSVAILTEGKDGNNHFRCKRILSAGAIAIISGDLDDGKYKDRDDEREPPFMAPSSDPDDYSLVRDRMGLLSDHF